MFEYLSQICNASGRYHQRATVPLRLTVVTKWMLTAVCVTSVFQSYPGPSLESEDFNIPPITPPSLPDHSLVHLNEVESGYHSLCHPMNHNGLLPFHPQNMDLPEITVSNMLGQDGTLLTNSISVVRMGVSNCAGLGWHRKCKGKLHARVFKLC